MSITPSKKIVICTILYKPDKSAINRIQKTADSGWQIYFLDNTPGSLKCMDELKHPLIRPFSLGKNVGIGMSLRLMAATAFYEGFSQFLYFDQDTIYTNVTLKYIEKLSVFMIEQNSDILKKFACITFRDFSRTADSKEKIVCKIKDYSIKLVDFTISSGSLFDLNKLKISGWHDESFFIDGVDYAVCIAIAKSGYLIGEIGPTPDLDHKSEQDDENYKFFNYQFRGRRYPGYRVKDYLHSTIKLLSLTLKFSLRRSVWIIRNLIIFIFHQVLVRIINN